VQGLEITDGAVFYMEPDKGPVRASWGGLRGLFYGHNSGDFTAMQSLAICRFATVFLRAACTSPPFSGQVTAAFGGTGDSITLAQLTVAAGSELTGPTCNLPVSVPRFFTVSHLYSPQWCVRRCCMGVASAEGPVSAVVLSLRGRTANRELVAGARTPYPASQSPLL
jgi:hypothetical protein